MKSLEHAEGSQHRLANELEVARATSARLNARVNELVLGEQVAKAEAQSIRCVLSLLHVGQLSVMENNTPNPK